MANVRLPQSRRRESIGASLDREELRRLLRDSCPPAACDLGVPPAPDAATAPPSAAAPLNAATAPLSGVPAAVLVGLLADPEGPRLILTQRTPHLRIHADQISFPGGRLEESDAGPAAAALREAFEEIGLQPAKVELLGCLPLHLTVTDFLVHPFVGWIEPPVEFRPDPHEVAQIIQVPLEFVLDTANHRRETLELDGVTHTFYVLYYAGHRIWGATAGILVSLARVVGGRA